MGILNPFYDAVAWVLMRIHALLSVPFGPASGWAWGLSIVFLVMLMRLIMVPLFVKQMHAQRKMAALAPQVAALRKKYKDDKQTMNQEVMKLYQENGANPLGGLPAPGGPASCVLRAVQRAPGHRRGQDRITG